LNYNSFSIVVTRYSFHPNPEDIDKIRELFKEDLIKNNLGMKSHLKDNEIYFYFPISIIVGNKI
jgi:hypothetical protein